ncbi:MAG: ABC transporter permease subunit [Clostridia bacterium]|nr:ABC transporter permease subunit [Clostridia bacterium]
MICDKWPKTVVRIACCLMTLLLLSSVMLPGSARGDEEHFFTSIEEFYAPHIRLGVQTGTSYDVFCSEKFPLSDITYFTSVPDMMLQLKNGSLDGFTTSEVTAREMIGTTDGITYLPEKLDELAICMALPKDDDGLKLQAQLNEFLTRAKDNGTLDAVTEAWLTNDTEHQVTDYQALEAVNGTIRLGTESAYAPYAYIRNGCIVGIDIDLMIRFCRETGYGLEVIDMSFDALIPSLGTRSDIIANGITYSDERAEKVLFSVPYSTEKTVMLVRCPMEKPDFFTSLKDSFVSTFIRENRWQLLLQGLWTTMVISLLSGIFGTLLGFGICLLRRRKNKICTAVTTAYIRLLQGTPIVVLLLILYYVVFTGPSVTGLTVAVAAFTMNFAAYVSEMMRTGIDAVPAGQMEAALAMGYTRRDAFFRIVMPQAALHFLPVYKGEVVSLLKSTSVVGYITVQDLTKMSDIIRSRTYDALFPLITTAVIYFAAAALLGYLVSRIEIRLKPDRVHRCVKGVKML